MIETLPKYAALVLLVIIATLAARRVVIAENEAGVGARATASLARSARVKTMDTYLHVASALLFVSLAVYFLGGLQ